MLSYSDFELINVLIYSLLLGSLLNVLIYRIPLGLNFINVRSICTSCKKQLKWYHNIPIFSWIFLKGKCGYCKSSISYRYPIVEFLSMFIAYDLYIINGLNFSSISLYIVFVMLLSLSFIDFKYKAIPDNLSIIAVLFSFVFTLNTGIELNKFFIFISFIIFLFFLKFILERILKKEVLGIGDFYIFIIIVNLFNFYGIINSLTLASIFALMSLFFIKLKNHKINIREYRLPFVPYLTIGIFLVYFLNINIFN
jgi:leader peptidase (prepilin peptidase)/N-methyltransferase